jgi:DNA-directed RNA polymerase specialized sigma24 family protein
MPFTWHEIHENLLQSSSTLGFQRDFDAIRHRHRHVSGFGDPAALLDALHHGSDTPGEKNLILTTLIEAAQSDETEADSALALMLLVLWPGLDAVLGRVKRRYFGSVDELASDVLARATEAIRCLDLDRVHRIAATILRNVERDLARARQREADRQKLHVETDPDELMVDVGLCRIPASRERLHHEVSRLIGPDATLVLRVAVDGFSRTEAAVEFGLSEEATRKRYQRATRWLRVTLHEFA